MGTQQRVALRTRMIRSTHDLSLTGRFCGGPVSAPGPSPQVLVLVLVLDGAFASSSGKQAAGCRRVPAPFVFLPLSCISAIHRAGARDRRPYWTARMIRTYAICGQSRQSGPVGT
ncbi:hypothetical protein L226DRAFT_145080 [Lentinus tigrinus ALCF2SS1-7]|uniref:uncharacterized protein n=1 Tax=Lentinus tigrinus ALCF2SS1-7 TaxID=1328758 RepID=UPI001165EB8A|nr:hypothetical protein L226DRAFT_145080 [Lentinus tigrinus ALCF2SS1-7]